MTDVKTSVDLDAWQIGSAGPPAMCLCCGARFDEGKHKMRGPYLEMPYIWVCQWCWEKPYLFFPDKEAFVNSSMQMTAEPVPPPRKRKRGAELRVSIVPQKEIRLKQVNMKVKDLRFDIRNPRLRHLGTLETEADAEKLLWREPSTRTLFREIEYTQGISEPLIIDEEGIVREGNRRLVCLKKLIEKIRRGDTDVPMYKVEEVPCFVFSRRTQEDEIALLQALDHVTGKKEWRPVDQAAHVFDLRNRYGLSLAGISDTLGRSQSNIRSMEKAYKATLEYHELFPDENSWMGKYSYFFEAYRHRQTTEWLNIEGNLKRLAEWIHSGRVSKGAEIRNLQLIIGDTFINSGRRLTKDQKKADKRLVSLNNYSQELLANLIALKNQGRLTKDALVVVKKLHVELTRYIKENDRKRRARTKK
jgi:hypothetical protein